MGPRASLDMAEKRKILHPCREVNCGCPTCNLVIILTKLS